MQIIIVVNNGQVTDVHYRRQPSDAYKPAGIPDVYVVDVDNGCEVRLIDVEPLAGADTDVLNATDAIRDQTGYCKPK